MGGSSHKSPVECLYFVALVEIKDSQQCGLIFIIYCIIQPLKYLLDALINISIKLYRDIIYAAFALTNHFATKNFILHVDNVGR